ncbi:MAG: hypothetical protein CVV44_01830 [Spirochaetae bacterium HGW-Spirochaetae-1]|jgi:predicted transcriptional regulator|nr:MAG: hypothetical protein CVV44_01830 [Spirochaetae bacterium HGW-Spirochaetae-1]
MKTAGEILKEKKKNVGSLITVPADSTLFEALQVMAKNNIGAVLVRDARDAIVGIWTERDLVHNSAKDGFDCRKSRVRDHMTTQLKWAQHTDSVYNLMDKFLGMKLRHLLIKKNDEYIGMLSSGDVLKALLVEKNRELKEVTTIVGWEYYENWKVE